MPTYTRREVRLSSALEWLWVIILWIILGISLLPSAGIIAFAATRWTIPGTALLLPPSLFVSFVLYVTITGLLKRMLPPVAEGTFRLETGKRATTIWMLHYGINNYLRVFGFQRLVQSNPLLRRLYFSLYGAKIDRCAKISYETDLLDPSLVEICEGTKIGAYTTIAGHYSDETSFILGRVRIARNVLVGGETLIGPGVTIGEGAIIEARSGILPNTVIPAGEVWGGSPARFRRTIHPREHTACPDTEARY